MQSFRPTGKLPSTSLFLLRCECYPELTAKVNSPSTPIDRGPQSLETITTTRRREHGSEESVSSTVLVCTPYRLPSLPVPEIRESLERERERKGRESESGSCRRVLLRVPRATHGRTPLKHTMKEQAEGNTKMPSLDTFPTEKRSGKGGLRKKGEKRRE